MNLRINITESKNLYLHAYKSLYQQVYQQVYYLIAYLATIANIYVYIRRCVAVTVVLLQASCQALRQKLRLSIKLKNKVIYRAILCIFLLILTLPILSNIASAGASDPFRFIAWADTKSGTSILTSESKIANGLNPAFTIYPGDLCDSFSTSCITSTWKTALNGGGTNNMFSKTFVTRGNHDTGDLSGWQSIFDFATTAATIGATNYSAQTADATYSFDYGNSHFVGIDLPDGDVSTMSSAEITWLDNDLTAAEGRGLTQAFLFWHGPIYYVDGHPSTPPAALITALNKHPIVSASFHGHEHLITYTHINSSRISTITHPFEEFISGAAGADLYTPTAGRYDYWLNDGSGSSKDGFLAVDVSGSNFNVSVYNVDSSVDKTFSFSKGAALVSTPAFSPPAGTYSGTQSVSISTATSGATIHYTTNGAAPTESSPTYTSPITISSNTTLKAEAWETGMNPSAIATAMYTTYNPVLTTITVSPSTASITQGSTQAFTAQPKDQNGNSMVATVTWTSSNMTVGTIDPDTGVFNALATGTTMVNATNGSINGSASVAVSPAVSVPTVDISGFKINDINGNGIWDPGETGILGWNITLKNIATGAIIASASTNATGFYKFMNLANGTYNVTEEMKSGWNSTNATFRKVTIMGKDVNNVNFTNQQITATVTFVVTDSATSSAIQGASVIFDGGNKITIMTNTDATGTAIFTNVSLGTHNYAVSMKGYKRISGTVNVAADTKVSVQLVKLRAHVFSKVLSRQQNSSNYSMNYYPTSRVVLSTP